MRRSIFEGREYGKPHRHRRCSCEFFAQADTDTRPDPFSPVIVIRYPSTMNNDTEISIFSPVLSVVSFRSRPFFFIRLFFVLFLFSFFFSSCAPLSCRFPAPDTLGKPRYKVHSRFPAKPGEVPRRGGTPRKEPEKVSRIKLQTRGVNLYGVKTPTLASKF